MNCGLLLKNRQISITSTQFDKTVKMRCNAKNESKNDQLNALSEIFKLRLSDRNRPENDHLNAICENVRLRSGDKNSIQNDHFNAFSGTANNALN